MRLPGRALAALTLAHLAACATTCGDGTTKEKRAQLTHLDEGRAAVLENGAGTDASSAPAPLVVALHGRGDTPESFSDTFHAYPTRATFVFLRGPRSYGEGASWFELHPKMTEAELAREVSSARDAAHARIAAIARGRRYAVVGFSQGGFLAFALAARYPSEIACALPIAGTLPEPLHPRPGAKLPDVFAFHGERDTKVPLEGARATAAAFTAAGGRAELVTYPTLGHTTDAEERQALGTKLDSCLEGLAKPAESALPSPP